MGLTCPLHEFHLCSFTIVDYNEMNGNHLIVTCSLHDQGHVIKSHVPIDCSTTSDAFIDKDYAYCCHLPLHLLKLPSNLIIIDERHVTLGAITHKIPICLVIQN
jgi:hypothetical protein